MYHETVEAKAMYVEPAGSRGVDGRKNRLGHVAESLD